VCSASLPDCGCCPLNPSAQRCHRERSLEALLDIKHEWWTYDIWQFGSCMFELALGAGLQKVGPCCSTSRSSTLLRRDIVPTPDDDYELLILTGIPGRFPREVSSRAGPGPSACVVDVTSNAASGRH